MPAPQQSNVPVYKETANIPTNHRQLDYVRYRKEDSAGHALAKLLKVGTGKLSEKYNENKAKLDAEQQALDVAHAQAGLERMNLEQSRGGLNLLTGDFEPDAYAMKQGSMAGTDLAGALRDKYLEESAHQITDPAEFNTWLQGSIADHVEKARARGPQYYQGFITSLGQNVELISKEYAGHATSVIENATRTATKNRLKIARAADTAMQAKGALADWTRDFFLAESGGNFNAWFGNAGNKENLGALSLKEIRQRQAAPGNDAAGILQIVPGTLDAMVKKYGYDWNTKFTPEVQMEMAFLLMKEKGLDKWLRGEMTDSQIANGLAKVWAGFKTTGGRGVYDGDGVNKGSQSASKTIQKLHELRAHLEGNPLLAKWLMAKEPKAGEGSKIIATTSTNINTTKALATEAQSGLSQKDARDQMANVLVEAAEAGELDDNETLEDEMASYKLSEEQRTRVREAVDARQKTRDYQTRKRLEEETNSFDTAIRTGDMSKLGEINKDLPVQFMDRINRTAEIDPKELSETSKDFAEGVNYDNEDLPQEAVRAFMAGEIDKQTYATVMDQYEARKASQSVLRLPAIEKMVSSAEAQLPKGVRHGFRSLLDIQIKELREQTEGGKPPITAVIQVIKDLQASFMEEFQADQASRMARPEYQQFNGS